MKLDDEWIFCKGKGTVYYICKRQLSNEDKNGNVGNWRDGGSWDRVVTG